MKYVCCIFISPLLKPFHHAKMKIWFTKWIRFRAFASNHKTKHTLVLFSYRIKQMWTASSIYPLLFWYHSVVFCLLSSSEQNVCNIYITLYLSYKKNVCFEKLFFVVNEATFVEKRTKTAKMAHIIGIYLLLQKKF